MSVVIP